MDYNGVDEGVAMRQTEEITQIKSLWKTRFGPSGIHLFDRASGLNILLDEAQVPRNFWSIAPRQVSIALTNRCDLACAHCYAPKSRDELCFDKVTRWLTELDVNGTFGVGFGGGEPTLYRRFVELCTYAARETELCVTFTTHGHHINSAMAGALRGNVHFIRVSMDGVGDTYESIRRRPFQNLLARLENIRSISPFGINIVVNERTVQDLDDAAIIAADSGACELLLLPQNRTHNAPAITDATLQKLRCWVDEYKGPLKLCINEAHAQFFPTSDPLIKESELRAYAHIDAFGVLKPSSYHEAGIPVSSEGVLKTLEQLELTLEETL